MKKKKLYYGFDGTTLKKIGRFDDISKALEKTEFMEDIFYITTIEDWAQVAVNIIHHLKQQTK